ncbi:unnamed protein product [Linum trigynum]|uniref:Replication protein A 70 kDa DNA-binding subunit B/D first OB fold domain-containing protein n=1 Tax=Linum trigynum TaxID=586398 RepID=A0AAV2FXW9_9ROSI
MWLGANVHTDKVLHLDLILMDSKGNDIWVQIPPVLIEKFKKLLKENHVYIIKNFDINTIGLKYRPIGNPYLIQFSRKTTVHHVLEVPAIPTFKFSFLNASQMAGKLGHVVILSDVVGQLRTHSDAITTTSLTRKTIRKELTLQLIDVGEFKDELSFSSSGSTIVYRNLDIPAVKAFVTGTMQPELPVFVEPPSPPQFPVISFSELLQLQEDPDQEEMVFVVECKVVGIKSGWCYMWCPTCVLKPIQRQNEYYCVRCNKGISAKTTKYRVQLEVQSDLKSANGDLPPDELLQLGEGYMIHKDGSSSSIASGPASSQPCSDQSGQSATEKSIETPVDSDVTPDNKLKRKMPLE